MSTVLIFEPDKNTRNEIIALFKNIDVNVVISISVSLKATAQKLSEGGTEILVLNLTKFEDNGTKLQELLEYENIKILTYENGEFFEILVQEKQRAGIIMKKIDLSEITYTSNI